ncbi:hypothetical protein [Lacunimicrobium album]|jgi:hypothetical protein
MLRSSFFSAGVFVALWGMTFLAVDEIVLNVQETQEDLNRPNFRGLFTTLNEDNKRVINPPDWAAFSLMSIGSVTMLYAVALPKKGH